ncbi:uncharacterized protein LOC114358427 [Ostrinia furnacalis]|uniref:uncharacterized protein LOC114358427 n=1 Tax=Ostrinia furnacalis TaxID=93504 RepID=UPI00103C9EBC|nr:uncharacterized protein LOC114358427 [Ostrinia furnacalis]XP_028168200.1 uncharacterized protein LOC114358427 [Ostrinia furnacalis]
MKKNRQSSGQSKRKSTKVADSKESEKTDKVGVKPDSLDDEDQGFGGWLRSSDGIETMKLFVIANTIVMLTTIVYPHVQTAIEIISEMIYDPDTLY